MPSISAAPRADAIERVLENACGSQFTAAVARVEYRGNVAFERAYGVTRADASGSAVYLDSKFDLASITKLFVATLAVRAVADGRVELDEPLARFFPEWTRDRHAAITLRMLLAHDSGMNSGADYRQLLGHNVERYTIERDLAAPPGERVIYSDLGFIALGVLVERIYSKTLVAAGHDLWANRSADYRPPASQRASIPATEDDGWRGRVQGVVHDEKAYLMGGVAGHAGLFGTAADVAWLTEQYLGPLCGRTNGTLPESLIRESVREQAFDPVLRRGLGWALKTTDENSCGRWWSMETFGHTGFVGTCVWADPARDVQGVLLTNTVYFGRKDTRPLRAAFYEAILDDFDLR